MCAQVWGGPGDGLAPKGALDNMGGHSLPPSLSVSPTPDVPRAATQAPLIVIGAVTICGTSLVASLSLRGLDNWALKGSTGQGKHQGLGAALEGGPVRSQQHLELTFHLRGMLQKAWLR